MSDNSELKRVAEAALRNWPDSKLFERPECERFIDASRPDVVLALIAENDALAGLLKRFVDGEHEQDENQAERHMYFTEAQSLLALVGGELEAHTIVPDSAIKAAHSERDQLRAEVAGLRTGYEAYEQVNAGLKAEIEALRKDAELNVQIQRAAGELPIGWEIRVCVEHESGYVELWDQDGCEVDFPNSCESLGLTVSDAIDAAMGNGEKS